MVELRVPDRMAVLPVVMVVVMALLVVPQAKAQAVELAQMVAQVPVTQVGILEVAQLVGIPALVPMVGKQVVVLLTDPEPQVVQLTVAQVTALATEQVQAERQALETAAMAAQEAEMAAEMALATEQVLETAAMVAQEAEMAAAVEMEELAAEMALATVAPTLTHQP